MAIAAGEVGVRQLRKVVDARDTLAASIATLQKRASSLYLQVAAAAVVAVVSIARCGVAGALPDKLTPLIKPLMARLKGELHEEFQRRCVVLAGLGFLGWMGCDVM